MIRVALVITELDVGGAERQLVRLATNLDRRWFKPHVYALGPPPRDDRSELVQQLRAADVPVDFLGATRWWQFQPTVHELKRLLAEFQPHVMQSFLFHGNVIGSIAARQANVPRVALGMRVADPSFWRRLVERRVARDADRVVSVSQDVATAAVKGLRLRSEQNVVIRNGIDLAEMDATTPADLSKMGLQLAAPPLVFVGRLVRQKGVDRLIELVPILKAANRQLIVLGDGPERASLERAIDRAGASDFVHLLGWRADVVAILKSCQALLLPSHYEGMPNVVLEAMAVGLPILATPSEGVRELLGNDSQGQVLPFDVATWSAAIAQLSRDEDRFKVIVGTRNRQRVEERFSQETMVASYQRMFAELAAGLPGTTRFSSMT
ncbi:MAG TPA: glycosyltransferase [Pirellulaceae bacterium]|nr:glycosyltransferase [Pirellulaceae bacterium]